MKQSFIEGAVIVSAGGIAAKILGAFYRIPLTNLLGGQGMGVYQMVYPLYEAKPAPKELWIVPGAAHAMSYKEYPREYTDKVRTFVDKYIQ